VEPWLFFPDGINALLVLYVRVNAGGRWTQRKHDVRRARGSEEGMIDR
jgi:hypothetical protein